MRYETDHDQVKISHGDMFAQVDIGMADVILAMWKLGLRTQYSCQGGDHWSRSQLAYVLMDRKSGQRLEALIKEKRNSLSPASEAVAGMFLDGPRMHDLALSIRNYEFFRYMVTPQIGFKLKPKPDPAYFSVERSYQLAPHWFRTTYRWPDFITPHIFGLLEELH